MNKLSLFSGIGMDDLASEWCGIKTVAFVENEPFCQQVLKKHWPDVPIIGDVHDVTRESIREIMAYSKSRGIDRINGNDKETPGKDWNRPGESNGSGKGIKELGNANGIGYIHGEPEIKSAETGKQTLGNVGTGSEFQGEFGIDIISGGFPCQPHSVAGKRKGSTDERDLWPEFRRCVEEIRPQWVVAENVPGLFTSNGGHYFGVIISDLAALGYTVTWFTLRASDTGAQHRRERLFIVGYAEHDGQSRNGITESQGIINGTETDIKQPTGTGELADTDRTRPQGHRGLRERGRERNARTSSATKQTIGFPQSELGRSTYGYSDWMDGRYIVARRGEQQHEWEPPRIATGIKDRAKRIKAIGNANPPQMYYPIYKAIMEIELEITID